MQVTRVLLSGCFLLQILLVAFCATWFGLCKRDDFVCRPLFKQGGRAKLLQHGPLPQLVTLPPVVIVVPNEFVDQWRESVENAKKENEFLVVKTDSRHVAVCGSGNTDDTSVDVWVCHTNDAKLSVASAGVLIWYTKTVNWSDLHPNLPDAEAVALTMYIDAAMTRPERIKMKNEAVALSNSLALALGANFAVRVRHEYVELSNFISVSTSNQTAYHISQRILNDLLSPCDCNDVCVSLVASAKQPLAFGDVNATMLRRRRELVSIVHSSATPEATGDIISALFLKPSERRDESTTIPKFMTKLWAQRRLASKFRIALEYLESERDILISSGRTVPVTETVYEKWASTVALLEQASQPASIDSAIAVTKDLMSFIEMIRTDSSFNEPIDLPPDHYAGAFVPLMVPLLIPSILGFVREIRRYLNTKRKTGSLQGKKEKME